MIKKHLNIKSLYLIIIFLFAIPSIIHIFNSGFVLESDNYFHFFINNPELKDNFILNAGIYAIFFISLFLIYFLFLKKYNRIFKNIKEIIILIVIVAILFGIILPITSSDVFSYATTGEIQSSYGANPYYYKIADVKAANDTSNNEILNAITIWDNQLVIYGPLWSLICSIITFLSFSKVSVALILFKIFAIVVHAANVILIYKITRKKFWTILYGLNPYILFETISNVHNDIYLVFFTLLALYFFINKKHLTVALFFFACATCIKYITVLLVPIILIYYYRNETVGKRVLKCIKSGLLFIVFVIVMYLIYLRNIEMIFYVFIQQSKYRESILTLIYVFLSKKGYIEYFSIVTRTISLLCIAGYVIYLFKLLFTKEIKFRRIMNEWNVIVLLFILIYISNLCVWYFVWLFTAIGWQNARNTRIALYLPLIYELLISYYFYLGVENASKTYCFSLISILVLLIILFAKSGLKIENKKIKNINSVNKN